MSDIMTYRRLVIEWETIVTWSALHDLEARNYPRIFILIIINQTPSIPNLFAAFTRRSKPTARSRLVICISRSLGPNPKKRSTRSNHSSYSRRAQLSTTKLPHSTTSSQKVRLPKTITEYVIRSRAYLPANLGNVENASWWKTPLDCGESWNLQPLVRGEKRIVMQAPASHRRHEPAYKISPKDHRGPRT